MYAIMVKRFFSQKFYADVYLLKMQTTLILFYGKSWSVMRTTQYEIRVIFGISVA